MSERSKQSKKPAPWFRVFSAETITKTLGLNAAEFAVYFRLLLAMNEADEPVGGRALEMLPGLLGLRKKTFSDAVETLIERNLIERLADGLWSAKMDDERAFRDRNSDKARTNSVKRWRKTEQNQSGSDASHSHTHREPPEGGSRYEDNSEGEVLNIEGSASAYAGRPDTGEEREGFTAGDSPSADEANSVFAEAFEALCRTGDDLSVAGQDGQRDSAEPQPAADDDGEDRIPFDDPCSDECDAEVGDASSDSQAEPIAAVAEDRTTLVAQKHRRWPDEFDPDAVYDEAGEPIRDGDADEADYDFDDEADEETHEGARQ